jgi:hypothetical protein
MPSDFANFCAHIVAYSIAKYKIFYIRNEMTIIELIELFEDITSKTLPILTSNTSF